MGGAIQWGLPVGLPRADTCDVRKLLPSDLSHTHQSGRQTQHMFNWMFKDRTLKHGFYVSVCPADLIHQLYWKSVPVVQRWMVRLKRDLDVHALFWKDSALYWHHTEHTQPTVILGSCRIQEQKFWYASRILNSTTDGAVGAIVLACEVQRNCIMFSLVLSPVTVAASFSDKEEQMLASCTLKPTVTTELFCSCRKSTLAILSKAFTN